LLEKIPLLDHLVSTMDGLDLQMLTAVHMVEDWMLNLFWMVRNLYCLCRREERKGRREEENGQKLKKRNVCLDSYNTSCPAVNWYPLSAQIFLTALLSLAVQFPFQPILLAQLAVQKNVMGTA